MIKKFNVTYISISMYFLLSGVEYAVILPTLNLYLRSLNASSLYIGLVLSAFSLAGLISAPIFGHITDITGSTKAVVLFSNLFEIGGNLMYFFALNPNMVLASRFIAGIGTGSASSLFGMIARATTEEERTATFSQLMSFRQIGFIIGPAFNLFLTKADFYLGHFHVDTFTSAGIFMALLWTIVELLMLFFYHDYAAVETSDNSDSNENPLASDSSTENTEDTSISAQSKRKSKYTALLEFFHYVSNDLLHEGVILCLIINFNLMFAQSGVETLFTPLTLLYFGWKTIANSIEFFAVSIIIVASFFIVGLVSKKYSDRSLLLFGCVITFSSYLMYLLFLIFAADTPIGTTWILVLFLFQNFTMVVSFPFIWVPQASMFSKLTSAETQGFNQGIRMLMMKLGQILGPLWASSLYNNLALAGSVILALVTLNLVLVIVSYKRLDYFSSSGNTNATEEEEEISERSPLLKNENTPSSVDS